MRATAPVRYPAALVLLVVLAFASGCTKSASLPPKARGVFYQPTDGKPVMLFKGTGIEMAPRSMPVAGTRRPSFLVSLPDVKMSEVRIGVDLADGKSGPFQRVDVTATPVEGQNGVYTIRPNTDLPPGLCAVVVGFDDVLMDDRDNVYPFRIVDEKPAS